MDKKELNKLIAYFIMGDGGVYYGNKVAKNCIFIMNMLEKNSDYVYWAKDVFSEIVNVRVKLQKDYNTDGITRQPLLRLETSSHPILTKMRDRIYVDKYKSIDEHYLKMLDWESLAILYMSDGSLFIDKPNPKKGLINFSYSVNLNMKRLSYGDHLLLKHYLKKRLGLEWNINKHNKYFYLRMRSRDLDKFIRNISPFVLPSFNYKVRMGNPTK